MSLPLITASRNPSLPLVLPTEKPPEKDPVASPSMIAFSKLREDLLDSNQSLRTGTESSSKPETHESRLLQVEELQSIAKQCKIQQIRLNEHNAEQHSEIEMNEAETARDDAIYERLRLRHENLENRRSAVQDNCCHFLYLLFYNTIKKICILFESVFLFLFPCLCQQAEGIDQSPSSSPQMDESSQEGADLNDDEIAHSEPLPTVTPETEKYMASKQQIELLRAELGLVEAKLNDDEKPEKIDAKELRKNSLII